MPIDENILQKLRQNDPSLTTLDLSVKLINDADAGVLAEALKGNTALTSLNLWWNHIGGVGAEALAEALKQNTTLTSLNLSWNQIGDVGAEALAKTLNGNTSLTSLTLCRNQIGEVGAKALAEALKQNTTLTRLYLSSNRIGEAGAEALAEVLKKNLMLRSIRLSSNEKDLKKNAAAKQTKLPHEKIYDFVYKNAVIPFIKKAWTYRLVTQAGDPCKTIVDALAEALRGKVDNKQYDLIIETIKPLIRVNYCNAEDQVECMREALTKLDAFISSIEDQRDELPKSLYPKELARLLKAKIALMAQDDPDDQVEALALLMIPFADQGLQHQAHAECIGLLNNDYFGELAEGTEERKVVDVLILVLSCQFPLESDITRLAASAYARLTSQPERMSQEFRYTFNNPQASRENFEQWLNENTQLGNSSFESRLKKCLTEIRKTFQVSGGIYQIIDSPDEANTTFFERHPNVQMGLAVSALIVGLAAIALATVATCGVAGLLGVAAASFMATLTLGASLTTVSVVSAGVGLFGCVGVAGGAYLAHSASKLRPAF